MQSTGGQHFVPQNDRDVVAIHTAVVTFMRQEIQNLADFGDLVAIDPTFPPLCLGWNVIPLTVVGRDREVPLGGLVMSVTSRGRFRECL
jgi:hypothetical protein